MYAILTGDWHIRPTAPKWRTSDYYKLLLGKLQWIVDFAIENGIKIIIPPGDVFDSPDVPNRVKVDIIKLLRPIDVLTIFGQHDLKYRQREDTALQVFIEDGTVKILNDVPIYYGFGEQQVDIYGASWEEEIPKVENRDNFNILAIHKMIVKKDPLFPDQTDFIAAKDFSKQYKDFDVVISGDNHNSFSYLPKKETKIINCGSLMRSTTAQYDHKPCIWIIDTETGEAGQHFIPIKPVTEVFKPEAV